MKIVVIVAAFLCVCFLLGSSKPKKGRKRNATSSAHKKMDFDLSKIARSRRVAAEKECRKRLKDVGSDLAIISDCFDCEPSDPCKKWHGRIISVFGKTPGFPTLADLDTETIFGGEVGHRLDYVDEVADAKEIERQKNAYHI